MYVTLSWEFGVHQRKIKLVFNRDLADSSAEERVTSGTIPVCFQMCKLLTFEFAFHIDSSTTY
jgi:hypothetical protein